MKRCSGSSCQGDQDVESDVEDAKDVMSSSEEAFKPPEELKVDDSDDSEDDEVEPLERSARKTGCRNKFDFKCHL